MSVRAKTVVTVECDGCYDEISEGDSAYCRRCRTLPDRRVDSSEVADGLRDWVAAKRNDLTRTERDLLHVVADAIQRGHLPSRRARS